MVLLPGATALVVSVLVVFWLAHHQRHELSVWVLYAAKLLLVVVYSFVLGLNTHFYFWLLVASITPIFLYPNRSYLSLTYFVLALGSLAMIMVFVWQGRFLQGFFPLSPEQLRNFLLFSDALIFPYFGYKCWIIFQVYKHDFNHQAKSELQIQEMLADSQALNDALSKAQASIQDRHDYLRTIIDVLPHSIFVLQPDGNISMANQNFANQIGIHLQDIIEQPIGLIKDQAQLWTMGPEHTQADKREILEAKVFAPKAILTENGITKWYQTHRIPILDARQQLHELLYISMDVSDQIENEAAIQASEQKYRALFESSAAGIIIVDIEGRKALDCNFRAQELFEATFEEILEGNTLTFSPDIQPNGQTSKEKLHQLLKEFRQTKQRVDSEWQFRTLKGRLFEANVTYSPLHLNGSLVSVLLVRDITEQKRAQRNLQEKVQELDLTNEQMRKYIESNLQLENFAYMASHDLKEPLRTTIAFSQLLERRYGDRLDHDGKEFLKYILDASKSMSNLINDLLAYSRVNTKGTKPEQIRTKVFLKNILQQLWSLLKESQGEVDMEGLPKEFLADRMHMHQLFQNLITNGLKFRRKGIPPKITIRAESKGKYWQFSVSDNGIGIEPKYHEKIFLLFRKLHSADDYEGTGIGLAMCKNIVEKHGGTLWLESEAGKGTTFYFTLLKKPKKIQRKNLTLPVKQEVS